MSFGRSDQSAAGAIGPPGWGDRRPARHLRLREPRVWSPRDTPASPPGAPLRSRDGTRTGRPGADPDERP